MLRRMVNFVLEADMKPHQLPQPYIQSSLEPNRSFSESCDGKDHLPACDQVDSAQQNSPSFFNYWQSPHYYSFVYDVARLP